MSLFIFERLHISPFIYNSFFVCLILHIKTIKLKLLKFKRVLVCIKG